jgi:signal transduction histidine kinase
VFQGWEFIMSEASPERIDDSEQIKELGHLSAAVGHHVINAFSAVVSNAELIKAHVADPSCDLSEVAALSAAIIETALDAAQVPRRLIDWTRRLTSPGSGPAGELAGLVDLNAVVRDTVDPESGVAGSQVEWVLNLNRIPLIRGDVDQLRSLLGHLIRNAREALAGGAGTITFTTQVDSRNWVVLEVRDSGAGMQPQVLKRATEPFFTTKAGHSGTGLTIAHGIWRRHRGGLSIESHPGMGTIIRLAVEPATTSQRVVDPRPAPQQAERPPQRTLEGAEPTPIPEAHS